MSGNFHIQEYAEETNKMINCKIKSALRKIHKLKQENRTLSSRRKELIKATSLESKIWLKTVIDCILSGREFNGVRQSCENNVVKQHCQLNKISEKIGKNGNKIQRLRTKISQLKKSLIPVVDE